MKTTRALAAISFAALLVLSIFVSAAWAASPPAITTAVNINSSTLTPTNAAFQGQYNPNGALTQCDFDYVSDANYLPLAPDPYAEGEHGSCNSPSFPGGQDWTFPVGFGVGIQNFGPLQQLTQYHLRVTVESAEGSDSQEITFTTPWAAPDISNVGISNITVSGATVTALIDNHNADTSYKLEYGSSPSLGKTSAVQLLPAAEGPQQVSIPISDGSADSVINYKLSADNRAPAEIVGTGGGVAEISGVFKTAPAPAPPVEPQVTIISGPKPESSVSNVEFRFNKSASVASTECQIDDGLWTACQTGYQVAVGAGDHQFQVRGFTSTGAASQVAGPYYWTTTLPTNCGLKTIRTRLFSYDNQNRFRMVGNYKAYKKIEGVSAKFIAVSAKGSRQELGRADFDFKKAGVIRYAKNVSPKVMKTIRKANHFKVKLKVPGVASSCTSQYPPVLDVKKHFGGQTQFFPHDVLFTPNPLFAGGK